MSMNIDQLIRFRPDHVAMIVKDPKVSAKFYVDLGGVITSAPSDKFCEIELGSQKFHLIKKSNSNDAPQENFKVAKSNLAQSSIDHVCLSVESEEQLRTLCAKLQSLSGQFPNSQEWALLHPVQPMGLGVKGHLEQHPPKWVLYFNDPDRISIEVRSY